MPGPAPQVGACARSTDDDRSLAVTAAADRHLLFGLLELQNGLIDQGQLVAAFQAWTRDKARSLADHLQARGDLTADKRALLDALAEVHLEAHGGDVEKSLADIPANRSTRAGLAELKEIGVRSIYPKKNRTGPISVWVISVLAGPSI